MYFDYHVHSEFSDDSTYKMEDVIDDAIALGIEELCFTDHVDYGVKDDHDTFPRKHNRGTIEILNVDYPRYFKKTAELKERYASKIVIKTGLEFGIQTHTVKDFQKLYVTYDLDFVILSIHQVEDKEFWDDSFQKGRTQKEYNDLYYKELYDVIKEYKDYSVLGHLDVIKRYDKEGIYPFEYNKDIIAEILKVIIADGKGIELNTSSTRYGIDDTMPSRDILRLYIDLGGKIITLGSDSHKKEHLGTYIKEGMRILKDMGYEKIYTFDRMVPIAHKL